MYFLPFKKYSKMMVFPKPKYNGRNGKIKTIMMPLETFPLRPIIGLLCFQYFPCYY